MPTARTLLLEALDELAATAARAREQAAEEGDHWAAWLASCVLQSLRDTAERAEVERRLRGGR